MLLGCVLGAVVASGTGAATVPPQTFPFSVDGSKTTTQNASLGSSCGAKPQKDVMHSRSL